MKQYLAAVTITLFTAFSASVMADWMDGEYTCFVGGESGKTWIKAKTEDLLYVFDSLGLDNEYKYKAPMHYGIRFGAYADETTRVYINLNQLSGSETKTFSGSRTASGSLINGNFDGKSRVTNRQLTVSVDYLFDLNEPVKPFIGATLGVNWVQLKKELKANLTGLTGVPGNFVNDDSETKSGTAFAYGIQTGVVGQVGDFDIELGYRFLMHKNKLKFDDFGSWKIDNSQSAYLAVSYRF